MLMFIILAHRYDFRFLPNCHRLTRKPHSTYCVGEFNKLQKTHGDV